MIDQHVTSSELSKQLYEAGIVVESEFWWCKTEEWRLIRLPANLDGKVLGNCIPAPLSSELGELLPDKIVVKEKTFYLELKKASTTYSVGYIDDTKWTEIPGVAFLDQSEANARAKMLLYLKEKGVL